MKKLTSVIAAGVVGVTVLGAVDVKADEVKETVDSSKASTTEQVKQTVPTQADVDAAQAKLEAAKGQVKAQEQVTNAAQTAAQQAEAAKETAATQENKAAEIVKEATPETISKAEKDVTTKSAAEKNAEQSLSAAQEEQAKVDQAVEAQKAVVTQAEKTVEAKQADVTKAEKDVAEKQALLDGTGAAKVIQAADEAKANLAQKETAKQTADQNLASAKQADASRQAKVNQARTDKVTKEAAFKAADKDLKEKTAVATETAKDLAQKEEALTKAKEAVQYMNQLTVSDEYVAALKEYYRNYGTWSKETLAAKTENLARLSKELGQKNRYIALPADKASEKYETNHLPEEIRENLSLFAADLLNQLHERFGTSKVVVSKDVVKIINEHTSTSAKNGVKGHDTENLKRVIAKYGLGDNEEENIALQSRFPEKATLAELKHLVYNALTNFLFSTVDGTFYGENLEWGHAGSIAGLNIFEGREPKVQYLGVSTSYKDDLWGITNFLYVKEDAALQANPKFDKTVLANPYDSKKIIDNLNQAQMATNVAKQANSVAQGAQSTAQELYNQAQADLTQATEALAQAEAVAVQTPAAQQAQAKAQEELKAAQDTNEKAQANLAALNADVTAKKTALAAAKATLGNKQAALSTAQTALKVEQTTLAEKQTQATAAKNKVASQVQELSTAKQALTQAKERVEVLKNAPANLKAAQKALAVAQETLKEKKAILEVDMKKLEMLKAEEKEAADQHAQVMKAYQDYLEAQRQAKIAAEKAAIEKAGKTALPVFDASGQIVGYTEAKASSQEPLAYGKTNHQPVQVKRLPQTGEAGSLLGIMGGFVLSGLGLVGLRKRKED